MAERKKLGEILLEAGAISEKRLKEALEDQRKYGGKLGDILLDRGYISEKAFLRAVSQQLKIPAVDFTKSIIPEQVIHMVPQEIQEKHNVFPVATKRTPRGNVLILAMSDPTNVEVQDEIRFMTGYQIEPVIALESVIRQIIRDYWYRQEGKGSYRYEPDIDLTGWEPRTLETSEEEERFIPRERMIDFEEEEKRQERTAQARARPSRELLALLRLLAKKGIITEKEYLEELKKIK